MHRATGSAESDDHRHQGRDFGNGGKGEIEVVAAATGRGPDRETGTIDLRLLGTPEAQCVGAELQQAARRPVGVWARSVEKAPLAEVVVNGTVGCDALFLVLVIVRWSVTTPRAAGALDAVFTDSGLKMTAAWAVVAVSAAPANAARPGFLKIAGMNPNSD